MFQKKYKMRDYFIFSKESPTCACGRLNLNYVNTFLKGACSLFVETGLQYPENHYSRG